MRNVNNADVNVVPSPARPGAERGPRPSAEGYDRETVRLIELVFFAYRDFVAAPDEMLSKQRFGRAHHRVLHFVNRNPGLPVAELLKVLKITKQSLARVLRELVAGGFVEQRTGSRDRRQRLLFTTAAGRELAVRLAEMQSARIRTALDGLPPEQRLGAERFLFAMVDAEDRLAVARLIGGAPTLDGGRP